MKSFKGHEHERVGGRSEGVIIRGNASKGEIHTCTHKGHRETERRK